MPRDDSNDNNKVFNNTQQEPPYYSHYRGQLALAGTSSYKLHALNGLFSSVDLNEARDGGVQELEDFFGAKFYCPYVLVWWQQAHSD